MRIQGEGDPTRARTDWLAYLALAGIVVGFVNFFEFFARVNRYPKERVEARVRDLVTRFGINSDISAMISRGLDWRQREIEMTRVFPQNDNLLVVVIDGATADLADDAARRLADALWAKFVAWARAAQPRDRGEGPPGRLRRPAQRQARRPVPHPRRGGLRWLVTNGAGELFPTREFVYKSSAEWRRRDALQGPIAPWPA